MLKRQLGAACPALITFNYDLVLERTLWECFHPKATPKLEVRSCGLKYFFGICDFSVRRDTNNYTIFDWTHPPEIEIPYLKLHGSLNWDQRWPDAQRESERITPTSEPTQVVDEPLILPPVFNKMNSRVNSVWKTALEILRNAKHIIIVGYSLPKADIYMQYFLKSAVGPNSSLQKIIVFDPVLFRDEERNQQMRKRYLECFSPQFSNRIIFTPQHHLSPDSRLRGTFQHFTNTLRDHPGELLFFR